MVDFRYGPVELFLLGLEGDRPEPAVMDELAALTEGGIVRVLDFVVISKSEDGDVEIVELDDDDDIAIGELALAGLTGEEDILEFAELVPAGGSAAVVALEMLYARNLSSALAASGGVVLTAQRIPAPVVNALVDVIENEGE